MIDNGRRYFTVASIGQIYMFFTKIFVSGLTTALFYAAYTYFSDMRRRTIEPLLLILVIVY